MTPPRRKKTGPTMADIDRGVKLVKRNMENALRGAMCLPFDRPTMWEEMDVWERIYWNRDQIERALSELGGRNDN